MKKIMTAVLILALAVTMCLPASATSAAKARDITDEVKVATVIEMYQNKLPIVRADAIFMDANDYTNDTKAADWSAPGTGTRQITVVGDTGWTNFNNDQNFWIDADKEGALFMYPCIWSNISGPMTYDFEIKEDGLYEFVVVGCAQIKEENVGNDAKDRGFSISVDGGEKVQVNISDTLGVFRDYSYTYSIEEAKAAEITTANGVNSKFFQLCYYYNIVMDLKKGQHTFEYWHLEYSGAEDLHAVNGSRLNYAGAYVQAALTDAELASYVYPEVTTEEPTTKAVTTKAPVTSKEPGTEAPTANAGTTAEPSVTTAAPTTGKTEEKGCASVTLGGIVVVAAVLGFAWKARR
ncbi:MAG: hypothetical protein II534_03120 [Clostridia bacterium]|nr:hypothetical protein [Clostridia bacterium]